MAISTNTFTINANYTKADMINQLEDAFTWLGWHDKCDHTGLVTGFVDYGMYQDDSPGGGGGQYVYYYSGEQTSTTGVGTGASFYMRRYYGNPQIAYVNKPGYGYTNGEFLSFAPGEMSEGTSGIGWGCTVYVDPVSYGTTHNGFYTKNVSVDNNYPYGVLRHKIQDNKKYGVTYRAFQATSLTQIEMASGPFFHPLDADPSGSGVQHGGSPGSSYNVPRFCGEYHLDVGWSHNDSYGTEYPNPKSSRFIGQDSVQYVASSNNFQLDLNVFRSGIDTNFCVMSYRQPTLSSTKLRDNTFLTFIPHNFTTPVWDLDYVCLGGISIIEPNTNESQHCTLTIDTIPYGCASYPNYNDRIAEAGYDWKNDGIEAKYTSNLAYGSPDTYTYAYNPRLYNRDATYNDNDNTGYGSTVSMDAGANYNAVVKGVPLNAMMVPSPYNMPEDFGLIDFIYDAPSVNIQQGDTITISGTEVWTVIHGVYTQTTKTRGLLFVARKV